MPSAGIRDTQCVPRPRNCQYDNPVQSTLSASSVIDCITLAGIGSAKTLSLMYLQRKKSRQRLGLVIVGATFKSLSLVVQQSICLAVSRSDIYGLSDANGMVRHRTEK